MASEFCTAFILEASGQLPSRRPAILHANNKKDSSHMTLAPCLSLVLAPSLRLLLPPLLDSLKYVFPVLVQLQFRNHDLAWRYAHRRALPIRLLFRDPLDVDDIL